MRITEKQQLIMHLKDWERVEVELPISDKNGHWSLTPGERITLQVPGIYDESGWYNHGFVPLNDYSVDLRDWHGLALETELPEGNAELHLKIEIGLLIDRRPLPEEVVYTSARVLASGGGKQKLLIPFSHFDDLASYHGRWKFVRSVRISGSAMLGDRSLPLELSELRFVRRPALLMHAPNKSKAVEAGEKAVYEISIANTSEERIGVVLSHKQAGWESMSVHVEPDFFFLDSGSSRNVTVSVNVSDRVAPGGYEKQTLLALPNGHADAAESLELTTVRSLPSPYISMTEPEWSEVYNKLENHEWAQALLESYQRRALLWEVPEIRSGAYMFETHHSHEAQNAAIVWKLTGDKASLAKVELFFRRLVDSEKGYAVRMRACHQELVHEGEFFKHMAFVYDLVRDAWSLTVDECIRIEGCFRLFMDLIDWNLEHGSISNWTLAEIAGALFCAEALQDLERINRFLYGSCGVLEHLAKGTLDDGWWYECSVGYNLLAAGLMTEIAQSLRPWGINLAETWVPASYYSQVSSGERPHIDGLSQDIWGPSKRNYRSIRELWDSLLPFADYRGVVFGINDSAESKLPGISPRGYLDPRFDLAFYLYRKPEYADILRNCDLEERDLLFAVSDLPESSSKAYSSSAYADNAGVAVLRSQKEGRSPREQIQAAVKYGSHGGAHGQYDRTSLLSVMRYGRSFYNPESIWYSYHTFMYKFYVQNSVTHNMVVTDLKLQDPTEGQRLLFHAGQLFQACAVENIARWSNPPYGGWHVNGDQTFAERTWNEGRYVPIPDNPPEYGKRTDFTEPIVQRRLTIVTDDYVVLFDYVQGETEHTYDNLFHIKGLVGIDAPKKELVKRSAQLTDDPLSSAQFVTDCEFYATQGPVRARFEMGFGPGYDNQANHGMFNEDGPLNMDVHAVWPPQGEIIIGTDPEYFVVEKQLHYGVYGDEREIAEGHFGSWILGRDDIDVDVQGVKKLQLMVRIDEVQHEDGLRTIRSAKSVFWGDPYLLTEDGRRILLAELPLSWENVDLGNGIGLDYEGGPVKLAGELFENALPAHPSDPMRLSLIIVDLTGLEAVKFVASIGGDYPLGDETARRKLFSSRIKGKKARFVTVVEPFEQERMILEVEAASENLLHVRLQDGRVQEIEVSGLDTVPIQVILREMDHNGAILRTECSEVL